MPLNRAALHATDKIRKDPAKDADGKPVPGSIGIAELGEDEYIEILHVRDFPRDQDAERASLRRMAPVPLFQETVEQAAAKEPTLQRNDTLYWRAVWEYMCVRLHVRIDGVWADGGSEETPNLWRGTQQDRDDIWAGWGPLLQFAFQQRFGSIAPVIEDGEVSANGEPLTFRGAGGRKSKESQPASKPGSADIDRAMPRA